MTVLYFQDMKFSHIGFAALAIIGFFVVVLRLPPAAVTHVAPEALPSPLLTCQASALATLITNTGTTALPDGEASLMSGTEFFKAPLPGLPAGQSTTLHFVSFASNAGVRFQPLARKASHLLIRIPGYDAITFGLD